MLKNRTFIALGLLVLVGGATLWKVTRPDPYAEPKSVARSPLPPLPKDAIDELEITEPGKPAVHVKKEGAEWKLLEPVADRAHAKIVEQALEGLEALELTEVIAENPSSYEKLQIKDDEAVKVVVKKGGTALVTLLVGKTTHVRLEGDPRVWATEDLRRWAIVKEAKFWRDRAVVAAPTDQLARIEVAYSDGAKVVVKKEASPAPPKDASRPDAPPPPPAPERWIVAEGAERIGGALDESVASGLASTLAAFDADEVADAAKPEATGLGQPRATVTIALKDGKTHTILVGKDDGATTYVKRADSPRVLKASKYHADRVPTSPMQWRDKTIARVESKDVTRIEIIRGGERTVLERTGDSTWKASAPSSLESVDPTRVTTLLNSFQALRAQRYIDTIDPKLHALRKPQAVLTLHTKSGPALKLAIGAKIDAQYAAQLVGRPEAVFLAEYQVKAIIEAPSSFKATGAAQAAAVHQ